MGLRKVRFDASEITGLPSTTVPPATYYLDDATYGGSTASGTNNLVAIQRILNAIAATSSRKACIHVPQGTWPIRPTTTAASSPGITTPTFCTIPPGVDVAIVGDGPGSVLQVPANAGDYRTLFYGSTTAVPGLRLANLTLDHNVAANTTCNVLHGSRTTAQMSVELENCTYLMVDGCRLLTGGTNAINMAGQNAWVRNNSFTFKTPATNQARFDNSAGYLEVARAHVTNNHFECASADFGGGCFELHGPQVVFAHNTAKNYRSLAYVVYPYVGAGDEVVQPNAAEANAASAVVCDSNVLIGGASMFELITATSSQVLRGVKVTNNMCLAMRQEARNEYDSSGIAFKGNGDYEDIDILNNIIEFEAPNNRSDSLIGGYSWNVGIGVMPLANVKRCRIMGNTIKNAPMYGIMVGNASASASPLFKTFQDIDVVYNNTQDCGMNASIGVGYRAHLGLFGKLIDVHVDHHRAVDTGSSATKGLYDVWSEVTSPVNCRIYDLRVRTATGSLGSFIDGGFARTIS